MLIAGTTTHDSRTNSPCPDVPIHINVHGQVLSGIYSYQPIEISVSNSMTNSTQCNLSNTQLMNQKTRIVPRGIRNNNPLNIRIGNVWLGEVQNPTDPDFEQFVHIKYGLRAGFVLLRRYINHYHRNTVPMIIAAWAPSTENNTVKYIDYVCQHAHIDNTSTIKFEDKETMIMLVKAMCKYECGYDIDIRTISESYDMA